jgi:hypothetical protein
MHDSKYRSIFSDSVTDLYFNYKIAKEASNLMKLSACAGQLDLYIAWKFYLYLTLFHWDIEGRKCKIVIPSHLDRSNCNSVTSYGNDNLLDSKNLCEFSQEFFSSLINAVIIIINKTINQRCSEVTKIGGGRKFFWKIF